MKKLLLIIFTLFSLASFGQVYETNNIVRNNTLSPARVANALDAFKPFTATGTDTYAISPGMTIYAGGNTYTSGDIWTVTFTNANTGAATLNVNSDGAIDIRDNEGNALSAGDLVAGGTYILRYNGTHFRIIGATGSSGGSGSSGNVLPNQKTVSGTTYTVLVTDSLYVIHLSNVSGCTVTLPNTLPDDFIVTFIRDVGAGTVTFDDDGTSVLNSIGSEFAIEEEGGWASWIKDGSTNFYGAGALGPIGGGDVETVSGDGVDNTDPTNPVIDLSSYYTSAETDTEISTAINGSISYTFNDQTDDYTFTLTDFQTPTFLRLTKTGTATVTVPTNASVAVPIGRSILVMKSGTSDITYSPAGGVTIIPGSGAYTSAPNQIVVLTKSATNTWVLSNGIAIDPDALGLVPDSRQIAGLDLTADRSATALRAALGIPERTYVASASDVTTTSTSYADVTSYSFSVTSGKKYFFRIRIPYTASASTEGSRWAINSGAATFSYLSYDVEFNLTQAARAFHLSMDAYDEPATASATTNIATGGDNICIISGYMTCTGSGTVIARFAAENGGANSISAKRNGYGWVELLEIP